MRVRLSSDKRELARNECFQALPASRFDFVTLHVCEVQKMVKKNIKWKKNKKISLSAEDVCLP